MFYIRAQDRIINNHVSLGELLSSSVLITPCKEKTNNMDNTYVIAKQNCNRNVQF